MNIQRLIILFLSVIVLLNIYGYIIKQYNTLSLYIMHIESDGLTRNTSSIARGPTTKYEHFIVYNPSHEIWAIDLPRKWYGIAEIT